jgi:hypothetical protein
MQHYKEIEEKLAELATEIEFARRDQALVADTQSRVARRVEQLEKSLANPNTEAARRVLDAARRIQYRWQHPEEEVQQ